MENGVYLWFFVSNASHFMQPLDSTPNAHFKKNVRSYCGDAVFENLVANADLRSALFAAVYKAERDSYTRAVIKDGFLKTGIFPWDADKIRENARENIQGKIDSKVDAEHRNATEAMTTVLRMYLDKAKETNSSVRSRTSWVGKNGLFDPQQLLEYAEQQEQEKKRIEEEKEEKRQETQIKKRQREEAKEQQAEARRKQQCNFEGCNMHYYGGKGWIHCSQCDSFKLCPKHKTHLSQHERTHEQTN